MRRIAICMLALAVAACGSDSTAPRNTFTGLWSGYAVVSPTDTTRFVLNALQSGSDITGTGVGMEGTHSGNLSFTGTSTPSSVHLSIATGIATLTFVGSYVNGDSVSGIVAGNSIELELGLKRQ